MRLGGMPAAGGLAGVERADFLNFPFIEIENLEGVVVILSLKKQVSDGAVSGGLRGKSLCKGHFLVSLILAAQVGFSSSSHAAELESKSFVVAGNLGITTQSKQLEAPFWNTEVPNQSGGAYTVRFRPWDQMGLDGSEIVRLVGRGLIQVGATQMGFTSGQSPILDAIDLAGLSPDIDTVTGAFESFRPVLEAHYQNKENVKLIGLWSYQAQVLFCRDELKSLADLKGRRVRTSGASQTDFIEHFGGSGVSLAWGEVQQALQTGVLDCAITGSVGGYTGRWSEAARYLHPLPINWGASAMVANQKFWDGLGKASQEFLKSQVDGLSQRIWEQNKRENEFGITCNADGPCPLGKPAGMKVVPLTEREMELRREALLQTVLPRFAARCGDECADLWNGTIGKVVNLQIAGQ